jgi:hypothetical protein
VKITVDPSEQRVLAEEPKFPFLIKFIPRIHKATKEGL